MISHLVSLTLALPIGLRTSESTLSAKLSPSIHVKPSIDAKMALLAEAKAPNRRSKAMEKALLEAPTHKKAMADADAGIQGSHAQYDALKKQCVECKLAEDNVVSQLERTISLHDKADEKLDEYNSAKAAAEEASDKATTLEGDRDSACEGAPEADEDEGIDCVGIIKNPPSAEINTCANTDGCCVVEFEYRQSNDPSTITCDFVANYDGKNDGSDPTMFGGMGACLPSQSDTA